MQDLLKSEINMNFANSTAAGNLGVFFTKVRGHYRETRKVFQSRMMVNVIQGDIVLVSKSVLKNLG